MSETRGNYPNRQLRGDHRSVGGTRQRARQGPSTPLPVSFSAFPGAFGAHEREGSESQATKPPTEPARHTMIEMPPTTRTLYVTGHTVLALRHPSIGMGFNWRVDLWGVPGRVAHRCDDMAYAKGAEVTARAIGDAEIADLRPALRIARHPAARRVEPVWGATHVRAVLELAWQKLDAIVRRGARTTLCDNYDRRTMGTWLSPSERTRAVALGYAMAEVAGGMELDGWKEWLDGLAR